MKIISNYKDFYDYIQGKYGQDDKVILNRITEIGKRDGKGNFTFKKQSFKLPDTQFDGRVYTFYFFGEEMIILTEYKGKLYTEEELYNMWIWRDYWSGEMRVIPENKRKKDRKPFKPTEWSKSMIGINKTLNCPIVLCLGNNSPHTYIKYPNLSLFKMGSYLDPESIYLNLYNWLTQEPDPPKEITNKEKILSHGFDLKHSFRNTK